MSQLPPRSSPGLQASPVSLFLQLSVHLAYPGGLFSRNRSRPSGGLVCRLVWERGRERSRHKQPTLTCPHSSAAVSPHCGGPSTPCLPLGQGGECT